MQRSPLSHIDASGRPAMVDLSAKPATRRTATAAARVVFPPAAFAQLQAQSLHSAKGPVIDTAVVAGVMAAKQTHHLIPFCHPLPLAACDIQISEEAENCSLLIHASVRTTAQTGVEMEALTAASVAALTVYDMCKALSPAIRIAAVHLLHKSGGKSDLDQAQDQAQAQAAHD